MVWKIPYGILYFHITFGTFSQFHMCVLIAEVRKLCVPVVFKFGLTSYCQCEVRCAVLSLVSISSLEKSEWEQHLAYILGKLSKISYAYNQRCTHSPDLFYLPYSKERY